LSRLLISGERTQIEAVWRDLSKDFKNLRGVYPEGNDRGISLGVNTRTWAGGEANLHFNSYHRPWRTYYYEMPPEGYDASAKLQQELENLSISFRIRQTASNPDLSGFFRNQYRLNIDRHFSGLKLRGRGEIIQSHSEGEDYYTGWLISAGFEARIFSGALNFSVSGFDTPDYDCRIYQYEAEVPGMMSVPFYLGTGMALNLKYEHFISQRVMVAGKIGITGYNWRPEGLSEASDRRFSLYINYHLKSSADDE
jgi:hypothetical protein